ncbi:enoyl-CoA hydratase/3-hydroxyacyl-CoA dehydrogenase [Geothermobacter ehrlichii]|uniref:Enoyl-CoA hydratase/3-hydroxyacyl-CoA dehydrogenase n=1 Tax=Geothermobacter ehrlichii TaxID=213224 RepID=A0A5D3WLU2_9BACT|nr:3-hydroxyacyl-CoA dehydrogenase/enoyl-CoA hydratase family protein [Geothermobacter ehrlichii]TYO99411.1 enoyl-CoA hydratase/3-hydroxyacyl-CoA dehydrogenase [Geothermobacter ehrlichii]
MKPITTVGVVGAGTMGSAIAQHFIMKGLPVILLDQQDAFLEKGVGHIRSSLEEAMQRKLIDEAGLEQILGRLRCTTDQAALAEADLVVEAIFENLEVKKQLFAELEQVVGADCILASNTSSFLISDIAADLKTPERVVGVHYFYHAAKNKLVEIIPGEKTDGAIVSALENFYSYYDKTPILVKDAPGFAVNRFFVPWLNEAARLLEEGFGSIAFIDRVACEVFGVGMGPFALMNATGVPIAMHAADGLAGKLGPFYAPAEILCKQVEAKQDWDVEDSTPLNDGSDQKEVVIRRLVGASLGVAAQMVDEGVVDATSADLGARAGLRWPVGPFELLGKLGPDRVREMVESVFSAWDLPLPACLEKAAAGQALSLDWVTTEVVGDTGFIIFNLPDRMNPLGEQVMEQLDRCVDELNARDDIDRIIIHGKGKAFIAGADIKFFLDAMDAGDLDRIQRFTEFGHRVLNKIGASDKTTFAYLDGLTLGGGLELALACDYRIGTRKSVLAFPETGIGIYPGLGGTQRTSRLIGVARAKLLIATGQFINAKQAYAFGLVDTVIDPPFDWRELAGFSIDRPQAGRTEETPEEAAFAAFDGDLSSPLLDREGFEKQAKGIRRKAPIALKMAMELIDKGRDLDLAAGLQLELDGLKTIFATADAKTGLSSIITGQKPVFIGK